MFRLDFNRKYIYRWRKKKKLFSKKGKRRKKEDENKGKSSKHLQKKIGKVRHKINTE